MLSISSRFWFVLIVAGFLTWGALVSSVSAQSTAGIGLTPSLIEAGAEPGEVLERQITVTNLSLDEEIYYLFTRDITGVQSGGSPIFSQEQSTRTGYELSEWVTLSAEQISLAPGAEQTVDVTIKVPSSASPGSHFGGVFISKEPPRLRESGASVGFQVANIISIRIAGDAIESAQIRSLSTDKFFYGSTDVNFLARIENKGNVLVRPTGPLEIYNMLGNKISNIQFNESRSGVFPGTIRDVELNWTDDGLGFGRYEAIVSLVYGEPGTAQHTISSSVSFWILPMKIIKPALIVLVILLVGSYIGVKLYVQQAVAKMSGSRRLVRRQQQGPSTLLLVSIVMLMVTIIFLILLLALFA